LLPGGVSRTDSIVIDFIISFL